MTSKTDRTIALRFSASSETYDRSARAQPLVAGRIMRMIDSEYCPARILEAGCGTGMLTEKLSARFPAATIDALDISEKMIEQARRRFAGNTRVRLAACDARKFSEGSNYSLIASCSSLHWMTPLEETIARLACLLEDGGRMVLGLMVQGTLEELREARLRAAPDKPPAGRLPSAGETRAALCASGLRIVKSTEERFVLHYPSARALLLSLHEQGVTGGSVSLAAAPLNRAELHRLTADYDTTYGSDGMGVRATYHAAFFAAVKK